MSIVLMSLLLSQVKVQRSLTNHTYTLVNIAVHIYQEMYSCCSFLHFHEIVEGLYFQCSLSVCQSVCLSVNKIRADQMHRFRRGFCWTVGSDPFENGDFWLKVKVTVTQIDIASLWPWLLVEGQGHSDAISIFSSQFSVNFPTMDLSSLKSDQNEIWYVD